MTYFMLTYRHERRRLPRSTSGQSWLQLWSRHRNRRAARSHATRIRQATHASPSQAAQEKPSQRPQLWACWVKVTCGKVKVTNSKISSCKFRLWSRTGKIYALLTGLLSNRPTVNRDNFSIFFGFVSWSRRWNFQIKIYLTKKHLVYQLLKWY